MEYPKNQYIEEAFTNLDKRVDDIYTLIQNFCDGFDIKKVNQDFFIRCINSLHQESDKDIFQNFIGILESIFSSFSERIKTQDLLATKEEFKFIIDQMQEQLNLSQKEIEQLKKENSDLMETKSYENSEMVNQIGQSNIEKLYQEIEKLKNQNYKQIKQIESLDKENSDFLTQIPQISEECAKYRDLYAQIYSEKNEIEEQNKALQDEISSLRLIIDEYSNQDQSEFNSEKFDKLNKEIERLNDEGLALLSEYNSLKDNNENLIKSQKELTNEKNILNNKISELNQKNKQLFDENTELNEKVNYLMKEGQDLYDKYDLICVEKESLQQIITKNEQDIQKLNDDIQKLNEENKNLKDENSSTNELIKSINNDNDNFKLQNESLSNDLDKELIEKAGLEKQLKQKNEDINFLKLTIENKDSINQEMSATILNLSSEKDSLNKKVASLNKIIEAQKEIIRKQMVLAKNENERQIAQIKEMHNKEINVILETLL